VLKTTKYSVAQKVALVYPLPFVRVRVRGPVKVAAYLAFGLVVIAEQMLRLLG